MKREHAIVMGGSMAGLLAARVLSEHFAQVTLIDRDVLPQFPENRRGVPQGRHTHALLAGGLRVLNHLFAGFSQEAIAEGALAGDIVRDFRWFLEGACLARPTSGIDGLVATRPFLENLVRRRVLALPNVVTRQGCHVEGLISSIGRTQVTGVRFAGCELMADLIVDATGRGSRTPLWLEALGYERPPEERVEIALGYATRMFRRRPEDLDGDLGAVIPPTPEGKCGGVMAAQEGGRWSVTLPGHFGNYAPEDLEGFIEYTRTLPSPLIYDIIRHAEPLGGATSSRFPASLRRRYEKLRRFPEGYVVLGDGVSSFNPIYGQGMSVAAQEAMELGALLTEGHDNLAHRYFARIAKIIDIPWSTAVGNDLRMPETVGPRSVAVNVINRYVAQLHRAAHRDPAASIAFHKVANLLAPPLSILHPKIAARVFAASLRQASRLAARSERRPQCAEPDKLEPQFTASLSIMGPPATRPQFTQFTHKSFKKLLIPQEIGAVGHEKLEKLGRNWAKLGPPARRP